jgi:hypothetical protein
VPKSQRATQTYLTIFYSYWLRLSNRKGPRRGPRQHRYKLSPLPQCRSCRRIHSINLLQPYSSLHLSITVGPLQPPLASLQYLKQVFLKAVHHQLRPIRLQTFHLTYLHYYKMPRVSNNRRVPHNHHHKAQRLCLVRTMLSHQRCLQDRCVRRCHRIWQGRHRPQYRCKVGWEVIIQGK